MSEWDSIVTDRLLQQHAALPRKDLPQPIALCPSLAYHIAPRGSETSLLVLFATECCSKPVLDCSLPAQAAVKTMLLMEEEIGIESSHDKHRLRPMRLHPFRRVSCG